MQERVIPVVLALLLAGAGCAGRTGATAVPKSTPQPSPKTRPSAPTQAPPVTGTGSQNQPGVQVAAAPTSPPIGAPAPAPAPAGQAPPATASTYVYAPQQVAAAPPAPSNSAAAGTATSQGEDSLAAVPSGELQLLVIASAAEIASGEVVTVDVMASSSTAVLDAPIHLTFDPNVVEFVDGTPGNFLTQGGSSIVFLADGHSRPGDVAIAAGRVAREQGASGSGLLCRVRFRGVAAGTTAVSVAQAKAWGTSGEPLTVRSAGTTVAVR